MEMIRPRNTLELLRAIHSIQGEGYLVAGCTDFLAGRNGTWWDADCLIDLLGSLSGELVGYRLYGSLNSLADCVANSFADAVADGIRN